MANPIETTAMEIALDAARSATHTLPNPPVGCTIIDAVGNIVATGVHRGAGTPHAEVDALGQAGEKARGATAVVTLEPCNHTGRTGPCSRALIEAGVARVVYAVDDPNPTGAGGAAALREAGVEVESGLAAESASYLIAPWASRFRNHRPFVTWKFASTLDGLSAAPDGTSKWITSVEARRDVQIFRRQCDAIVAGTYTVLADDPRLNVRDEDDMPLPYAEQPLRVVVGQSHIPQYYRVFDRTAPTLLVQTRDPKTVLKQLHENGIHHVWLEGGPRLAGAFWSAGLIDRVIGYMAPALLGSGRAAIEGEAATIGDLRRLDLDSLTTVGTDIRIVATPQTPTRETK